MEKNLFCKVGLIGILTFLGIFFPVLSTKSLQTGIFKVRELALVQGNSLLQVTSPQTPERIVDKVEVVITAYSSTPWETDDTPYITAAGTFVREGIVAANFLPIGTKLKIPEIYGDRIFVVEDRMHPKKKYQIDIWFPNYWDALNFGAKRTYIEILEG